jgi:hypothetical protein
VNKFEHVKNQTQNRLQEISRELQYADVLQRRDRKAMRMRAKHFYFNVESNPHSDSIPCT